MTNIRNESTTNITATPPRDISVLQEQVKRMKDQAALAAQRARDDVQAVELAATTMKAKLKALQDEKMKAFIQEIKDQEELEAKRKKARDEHRRKKRERDRRERQNPTNIFQQTSNKKRRRRGKSRRR